ncbi:hypothetical protein FGO68_gene10563 [Halteria grandinella]|uniref:ASCH domain-containing protein n=1 Tax=Halteria grandinella TaxID=5974 RepID=A0A8J8P0J4_HALGN|nr:hypothetical protein FGO68_gene10563 [Halteria grandinella]
MVDQIKAWAREEFKKLANYLQDEDITMMVENLVKQDAISINNELSNLLDFTVKANKAFITEFIDRLENHRKYEEKVKATQKNTSLRKKNPDGTQAKQVTKAIKDVSKFLVPGRQICYCQCTRHALVNNCVVCGKIVCEQEGEGPCLFCGAWVNREAYQDLDDENDRDAYEQALRNRDRLIDYDVNAAQRLGVLDAQSDWFEVANDPWAKKDERDLAKQMQQVQKQREEEMDSKMNVTIDLDKGTTNLKLEENDPMFTFAAQNRAVNEFMANKSAGLKLKVGKPGEKYRPFEDDETYNVGAEEDPYAIGSFTFKAYQTQDERQKKAKDETMQKEQDKIFKPSQKGGAGEKQKPSLIVDLRQQAADDKKKQEIEAKARVQFLSSGLSQRLQDENPFDEFRKAVEKAVIDKSIKENKVFEGDQDFFREVDDVGMCLSMHQPWASLLVHGFKRFEGREWTHKFRGPLWIHSTAQKPSQELINQLEDRYREFYSCDDMPDFPDRYPTSVVVGRVDLVDVITLDEYHDTVPKKLQEPTECQYQFVVRNPCYLEMPPRMSGQPNIYKMDKALHFGIKELIKKAPYTWWPPKEYRLYQLGRFDIFTQHQAQTDIEKLIDRLGKQHSQVQVAKTNVGCYHLKGLLSVPEQLRILQSIRTQCLREPQKYKFSRSEALAEEEIEQEKEGTFDFIDGGAQAVWRGRNAKKEGAYVMTLHSQKDASEELKALGNAVEEGVNSMKGESVMSGSVGQHVKAVYKRFTFDFFKPQHGYMEKIPLALPKAGAKKKGAGKHTISAYLLCMGDSLKVDYTIEEEKNSYNYSLTLESGDVLAVNSEVKGLQYGVTTVAGAKRPKDLVLREGSLLFTVESN